VERQKADLEQRAKFGGKHSDEKKKEMEYNATALKYLCDRFKWSKVFLCKKKYKKKDKKKYLCDRFKWSKVVVRMVVKTVVRMVVKTVVRIPLRPLQVE
jgi:hypothetical protein